MTKEEINSIIRQIKNSLTYKKNSNELRLKRLGIHGVSMEEYMPWNEVTAWQALCG